MEQNEITKDQEINTMIISIGDNAALTAPHDALIAKKRKADVEYFIRLRLPKYQEALGLSGLYILHAWEKYRGDLIEVNFYQDYMLPDLGETVIFSTKDEFNSEFPSHKSICPNCKGESTDYYKCTSGKVVNGRTCEWSANPAMGMSSDYIRVMIKELFSDFPTPQQIFKPIELYTQTEQMNQPPVKKMV